MKTDRETAIVGTESEISYTALGWNPQEKDVLEFQKLQGVEQWWKNVSLMYG